MTAASILLVSHGFQPNYEKAFANGLAAHGVDVTLIASDRTLLGDLAPNVRPLNIRGSQDRNRSRRQKASNLVRYWLKLMKLIAGRQHDAVHLTGMFMTPSVCAGLLEWIGYRLVCGRFVMTVHNILPHGRDGIGLRRLYYLIYRLPHLLVVHTEKMKGELVQQFGVKPDRVVVMAHGVDEVPDEPAAPPPSPRLRVLLFGWLHHYKGVDQFLRAAALCAHPMDITIAGEAKDAAYAALVSELVEALPAQHQVDWQRGFIEEASVRTLFEAADVVVLPYRHIDQSGVLFTAFRFGAPLIVTDVGAFKESLPAFAGVVSPTSEPSDLAAAVTAFVSQQPHFDRERIRAHAQSLSWPNTVKPLLKAYQHQAP